jgi:hypothetical protein
MYMAKRGRARAKKTTRRGRARARFAKARKSPQAKFAGRNVKNIFVGSGLINITSKLVGQQTSRAGIYAQPLNLIITGAGSSFLGISGQKDLISAGLKIGGSRLISTQIEPRLRGMGAAVGTGTTTARRTLGGYI